MNWVVVKSLPLMEVKTRISIFSEKYGSLSLLSEEFKKGRMPPGVFDEYIMWTNMSHSMRAYQEGEDFEYLAEEDMPLDSKKYEKLTPKRLELLDHLGMRHFSSIHQLAAWVMRDVKNVYNDLQVLSQLGFVNLVREGNRVIPELLVHEISIRFG